MSVKNNQENATSTFFRNAVIVFRMTVSTWNHSEGEI